MVMSYISGSPMDKGWFEEGHGPTPVEEKRLRSLQTLAEAMSQLQKFQFDKIGYLEFAGESIDDISIGPLCDMNLDDPDDEAYGEVRQDGPFDSSRSCLLEGFATKEYDPMRYGYAADKVTNMMLSHLPKSSHDGAETFVLCHPDFNLQNIMIDEKGNLTGLIDWDNTHTLRRFLGYCCYPSFLTPDWDPLMYAIPGYPRYLSPEELVRYRKVYSDKMIQMLGGEGTGDAIFAAKSHIYEAVWIATFSEMNRTEIAMKFIEEARPKVFLEQYEDKYQVLYDLAEDRMEPEMVDRLERGIEKILSVDRPKLLN